MNLFVNVLIAAVTLNCLAVLINGKTANDTLAVPYIDMLLPPLEDVQENNKIAAAKINATAKATDVHPTRTTKAATGTTKNTISKKENNILPELSIEALLPPLYEATTERAQTTTKTTTTKTTTTKTTTTSAPVTRTTYKTTPTSTTTSTTTTTTTTQKPTTKTTRTTKSSQVANVKLPDLVLEPLLPPWRQANNTEDVKEGKTTTTTTTTTKKPITTTRKSYHQQQQTPDHSEINKKTYKKQQQQQQLSHVQANTGGNEVKNYNKPAATAIIASDKHVAESRTQTKQVSQASQQQQQQQQKSVKLQNKIETVTQRYVAKQKPNNSKSINKQHNYGFELYLGSTTPRPMKNGLPTITPFPHRLGR